MTSFLKDTADSINALSQEAAGPFIKYLAPKLLSKVGPYSEQQLARTIERRTQAHPAMAFAGALINGGITAAGTPGPAPQLNLAGRMADAAATNVAVQIPTSAAEIAHETQVDQSPLGVEQLHAAIGLPTILAAGLGAGFEALGSGVKHLMELGHKHEKTFQAGLRSKAEAEALAAVNLDPKRLPERYREGLGKRLLDEGFLEGEAGLDKAGKAKELAGRTRGATTEMGEHADWRQAIAPGYDAADALAKIANDEKLNASQANAPTLSWLKKQAEALSNPDLSLKDVYDVRTDMSSLYVNKEGLKASLLADAAHELDRVIAQKADEAAPGLGEIYRKSGGDYAFFAKLEKALKKAPAQANLLNMGVKQGVKVAAGVVGGPVAQATLLLNSVANGGGGKRNYATMLNKMAQSRGPFQWYEDTLGQHMDALFSGAPIAKSSGFGVRTLHEDYEVRRKATDRMSFDRDFHGRLGTALEGLPPPVQDAIMARASMTAAVLNEHAPKDPYGPMMVPHEYQPNDAEKFKYTEAWHTAENPFWVLQNPSPDNLKVAQAIHPEIMRDLTGRISARLAESPNLPYEVKLKVSQVIGAPLDPSQDPKMIQALQNRIRQNNAKLQGGKPQGDQRNSARTSGATHKADKAAMTRAQRLQSGM